MVAYFGQRKNARKSFGELVCQRMCDLLWISLNTLHGFFDVGSTILRYWGELAILQPKRNFGVIILDLHNVILALYVYFLNHGTTF